MQFAIESLGSPDKKKLAKSLKKKKLDSDSPDQLKVTFGDSNLKLMPSKILNEADLTLKLKAIEKTDRLKSPLRPKKKAKKEKPGFTSDLNVFDISREDITHVNGKRKKNVKKVKVPKFEKGDGEEDLEKFSNKSLKQKVKKIKSDNSEAEQRVKKEEKVENSNTTLNRKLVRMLFSLF